MAGDDDDADEPLDEAEAKEVEDRGAPRPLVVYEVVRREGKQELERSASALAWSGLAAGLSMGFSMVAQGLLRAHLPDAPWRPLVASFGYAIGFLVVILGRQQLFTENTLTPMLPLLHHRTRAMLVRVARLWGIVLVANLAGAVLFATAIGVSDLFDEHTHASFAALAQAALEGGFAHVMLRGVFAGWLIALMVWMLPGAETARPLIIILITYVVGLGGFSHVIAGAVEVFYGAITGLVSWPHAVFGWLVPTLFGNVLGGVALVAALNHAQVTSGEHV